MPQDSFKRKLTAILSADAAGYSRLMGEDEEATVRTITAYRETITTLIQQHNGKVLDSPGDNLLAEFVSVVDAVKCAVAVQKEIKARNDELPENRRMPFRIGVNLGDVIEEEGRIYGDGVNIAARLEGLAEPGGICISKTVFDHIENKLPYGYEFIGDQTVKNIAKPVGAYKVLMDPGVTVSETLEHKKFATIRRTQILVGVVAILILAAAVGIWQFAIHPKGKFASIEKTAIPSSEKRSIAVLPFDNMSNDPEQEYFSDGITEEIIARLAMNPMLFVIARNSTFTYKGKPVKIQQVGRELGVQYVLEGSVRKAGNMVRITAQLIEATTDSHLWAKTYDREFKDIFNLQDEIAQQIVAALNIKSLEAEQARAWRVPTENLTAYDSLLRGLSHLNRLTKEENTKAKEMFERAIELDPEFSMAYVGLGAALERNYSMGWNREPETLERAFESARKAISLNDSSSLAHTVLSSVYRAKGQYERAISQAERAISLNPNNAHAYLSLGNVLNAVGRSEEAVEAIKKGMQLDPHYDAVFNFDLAIAYRHLGQHEAAIASLKKAMARNPDFIDPYMFLAGIYRHEGRYEEAIATLKEALVRNPDLIGAYYGLAMNYRMAWLTTQNQDPVMLDRASEIAHKLVAMDDSYLPGYSEMCLIYLFKGDYEKALDEAKKLVDLASENADSYALLAVVLNVGGKSEEAIEMVEKAIQLNSAIPPWYLNTLGAAYASSGRQAEAMATYKRVFNHSPSHEEALRAHSNLAILYIASGQEKDARAESKEILKLVPHFSVEVWGKRERKKEHDLDALRKAGLK